MLYTMAGTQIWWTLSFIYMLNPTYVVVYASQLYVCYHFCHPSTIMYSYPPTSWTPVHTAIASLTARDVQVAWQHPPLTKALQSPQVWVGMLPQHSLLQQVLVLWKLCMLRNLFSSLHGEQLQDKTDSMFMSTLTLCSCPHIPQIHLRSFPLGDCLSPQQERLEEQNQHLQSNLTDSCFTFCHVIYSMCIASSNEFYWWAVSQWLDFCFLNV